MEIYKIIDKLSEVHNQQLDVVELYTAENGNIMFKTADGHLYLITKRGVYRYEAKRR